MCTICQMLDDGRMTKKQAARAIREYSPSDKHTEEVLERVMGPTIDKEDLEKQLEEMLREKL